MEKWINKLTILLMSLSFISCGGFSISKGNKLEEKMAIEDVSNMPYKTLPYSKQYDFEITEENPVFGLKEMRRRKFYKFKKSYSAFFKLPSFKKASSITIKSYCDCLGFTKPVYVPLARLYDEDFKAVAEVKFASHTATAWEAVHLYAVVPLKKKYRYLLIHSDPDFYGRPAATVMGTMQSTSSNTSGGYVQETTTFSAVSVWWKGDVGGDLRITVDSINKDE